MLNCLCVSGGVSQSWMGIHDTKIWGDSAYSPARKVKHLLGKCGVTTVGVSSTCKLNSLHLQLHKSGTTSWGFGGCWSRGKKVAAIVSLSSVFWGWQGMTTWGRMKGHIGNPLVTMSGQKTLWKRSNRWTIQSGERFLLLWWIPQPLIDFFLFFFFSLKMRCLTWKSLLRNGAVTTPKAQYNLLLPNNLLGKECSLGMWFRNAFYRMSLK